jgi:hypothetical protein
MLIKPSIYTKPLPASLLVTFAYNIQITKTFIVQEKEIRLCKKEVQKGKKFRIDRTSMRFPPFFQFEIITLINIPYM